MGIGLRTSGPIHFFARFRGQSLGLYLGTCVTSPEPEHEKKRIPVMNDLGGRSVPFQVVKDGEDAIVMATLNRFNYLLLQSIRALDSGSAPGGVAGNLLAGNELPYTRGTFIIGYTDFELILINQYAGTSSAGTVQDEPTGRIYFSADLQKYKESRVGTRVLDVALAIKCENLFAPIASGIDARNNLLNAGGATARGFRLYSENPTDFGTLAPIE